MTVAMDTEDENTSTINYEEYVLSFKLANYKGWAVISTVRAFLMQHAVFCVEFKGLSWSPAMRFSALGLRRLRCVLKKDKRDKGGPLKEAACSSFSLQQDPQASSVCFIIFRIVHRGFLYAPWICWHWRNARVYLCNRELFNAETSRALIK